MSQIFDIDGNLMYEDQKLSLKELVVKNKNNLRRADLTNTDLTNTDLIIANLSNADLSNADLKGANLSGANLREADLRLVDLTEANLAEVDLTKADLVKTNFTEADLSGADLNIFCKWNLSYIHPNKDTKFKEVIVKIGCKEKSIKDWDNWFDSNEEYQTKRNTDEFKRIKVLYGAYKYYIINMHFNKVCK